MVDTVVSSTATTASIALGTSVYGKIDKLGDHDWYRIELEAGKTYEFRLHGMGIDEITDPFLRLRDADGKIIGRNDNNSSWTGFNAEDSRLIFTATKSGTYFVDAATYLDANKDPRNPSDAIKGDFLLTAVEQNTNGMVFTPDEIAWQLIDNGNAFFGDPQGHSISAMTIP